MRVKALLTGAERRCCDVAALQKIFQEATMQKLKSIIFLGGLMLLLLPAAMGCLSIKYLSKIVPADSYEDKGVYTFSSYQILPVQV